eukprot:2761245-Rhodomonas_salina.1
MQSSNSSLRGSNGVGEKEKEKTECVREKDRRFTSRLQEERRRSEEEREEEKWRRRAREEESGGRAKREREREADEHLCAAFACERHQT